MSSDPAGFQTVLPDWATPRYTVLVTEIRPAAILLRELRSRQGKSLRATAADLQLDASYLSRLERGEKVASEEVSARVAQYYGVNPDLLSLAEGRVPHDVIVILRDHPELVEQLRAHYGRTSTSSTPRDLDFLTPGEDPGQETSAP
jgi:transcriptional regulator with XRE-family HTH domain